MRMLACADFRGNDDKGRKGQKDNVPEMRRLRAICRKEDVDASSLATLDRYGKLLALRSASSAGATVFEIGFKKIDYNGINSRIWSEIATRDSNRKIDRIQILPYVIGGPIKEEEDTKKDYSRVCRSCLD